MESLVLFCFFNLEIMNVFIIFLMKKSFRVKVYYIDKKNLLGILMIWFVKFEVYMF